MIEPDRSRVEVELDVVIRRPRVRVALAVLVSGVGNAGREQDERGCQDGYQAVFRSVHGRIPYR